MKKFFALLIIVLSLVACNGVSDSPYVPPSERESNVDNADNVDYDFYYPPVDMIELDYIEEWMLPAEGILTYAEDMGEYGEFTIGALNGEQYDNYLQTLEDHGMEKMEEQLYQNDTVQIKIFTKVFRRNPEVENGIYNASYLDVYVYDLR